MANLKQSEYAPIGDLLLRHLNRDLTDITARFTHIDRAYATRFGTALADEKALKSLKVATDRQKALTSKLYADATTLGSEFQFLKSYARPLAVAKKEFTTLSRLLSAKDLEEAIKTARSIVDRVEHDIPALKAAGMPDGFLSELTDKIDHIEKQNNEQNRFIRSRPKNTADNKTVRDTLYAFIAEVSKAGKLVYAHNAQKRKDYTLTVLLKLLRAK